MALLSSLSAILKRTAAIERCEAYAIEGIKLNGDTESALPSQDTARIKDAQCAA